MEHYPQFIGIAAATRPYGDMTLIGCHCLQASKLERLSHVDIISIQITLGHNDGRRDTFSRCHKWQSVGTRHSKFTAIPMVIKLRSIKQKNTKITKYFVLLCCCRINFECYVPAARVRWHLFCHEYFECQTLVYYLMAFVIFMH